VAVIAKSHIIHNGKHYYPGDEIPSLKKEEADRLIELDVITEEKTKSKSTVDQKSKEPET